MRITVFLLIFILLSCTSNDNVLTNNELYKEVELQLNIDQLKEKDSILRVQLKNTKNTFIRYTSSDELVFISDNGKLYVDKMLYKSSENNMSMFLFTFYSNSLEGNLCFLSHNKNKVKSFIMEGVPISLVSKNYENYELINILSKQKTEYNSDIIYSNTIFLSKINNNNSIISNSLVVKPAAQSL